MDYQWFPGHMTKALRELSESVKHVDISLQILDARIPLSSVNPSLEKLLKGKKRVVVLNKADLADEKKTALWVDFLRDNDTAVLPADGRNASDIKKLKALLMKSAGEKHERDRKKGMKRRPFRIVVSGIPNAGKSTIINSLKKKTAAKTGNKAGVTKGEQWIRVGDDFELLDTPGLLWPKFEDQSTGFFIALLGSMNDDIIDMETLALKAFATIAELYPGRLSEYAGIDETKSADQMLLDFAEVRHYISKGAQCDTKRAASALINEIRSGKAGRFTFELPAQSYSERQK